MKILFLTTILSTANAFLIPHIQMLLDMGYQVDIATNPNTQLDESIRDKVTVYPIEFHRELKKNNFINHIKELRQIIKTNDYDLVHTHTPVASAIVRLAIKKNERTKVLYTAHGFHFYKGAPLKSWLAFYPIERYLLKYTDGIITINNEDFQFIKKTAPKKAYHTHGVGVNLCRFCEESADSRNILHEELELNDQVKIILSVGELNQNKNHKVVIEALNYLNENVHYVVCGDGKGVNSLKELIKELNLEDRVHLLGKRSDIPNILCASDIFVFPSWREGLSVALMEAMAMGKPIIASNIRGNNDLIEHEKGGLLFDPASSEELANDVEFLLNHKEICEEFKEFNSKKIKNYSIDSVKEELKEIYMDFLSKK